MIAINDFADMLAYLRKREGLSQQDLGNRLGVAKSTISMYENRSRKPSFEMLEAIADYFNVNMDFLVGSDRALNLFSSKSNKEKLLELVEQMSREELKEAITIVASKFAEK